MLTAFKRPEHGDRSAEQMQITVMRADLAAQIERHTGGADGMYATPIAQLSLARLTKAPPMGHALHQPAFCLIAMAANACCSTTRCLSTTAATISWCRRTCRWRATSFRRRKTCPISA